MEAMHSSQVLTLTETKLMVYPSIATITGFSSFYHKMCGSRKYPYPSQGWSLEIRKGRGGLKGEIFLKEGMKPN